MPEADPNSIARNNLFYPIRPLYSYNRVGVPERLADTDIPGLANRLDAIGIGVNKIAVGLGAFFPVWDPVPLHKHERRTFDLLLYAERSRQTLDKCGLAAAEVARECQDKRPPTLTHKPSKHDSRNAPRSGSIPAHELRPGSTV